LRESTGPVRCVGTAPEFSKLPTLFPTSSCITQLDV
jgi:hypothetical protein